MSPITSSDPYAVEKLTAKLDHVNEQRDQIKKANRIMRGHLGSKMPSDVEGHKLRAAQVELEKSDLPTSLCNEALTPDYMGKLGIESWRLSNLTKEAGRIKKRIAALQEMETAINDSPTQWDGEGWHMWVDIEEERIFLRVEFRLTRESFTEMRRQGFNYSTREQRFSRLITPQAIEKVTRLAARLDDLIIKEGTAAQ